MLVMYSGKRRLTDRMELPNQDKIRTLGEKETYKYLGNLEANTIKQVEMKDFWLNTKYFFLYILFLFFLSILSVVSW